MNSDNPRIRFESPNMAHARDHLRASEKRLAGTVARYSRLIDSGPCKINIREVGRGMGGGRSLRGKNFEMSGVSYTPITSAPVL